MAKGAREKIKMESTAGTGYFVTTTKNKKTATGKLERNMFDPKARKHVLFKETKLRESVDAALCERGTSRKTDCSPRGSVGFFVCEKAGSDSESCFPFFFAETALPIIDG